MLSKGASATRTYQPRKGGANKNMDLYTPELYELMQTRCERFIKYFNYCTVIGENEDVVNPNSFFTYEPWHPYTGDFKVGEYTEMNKT